MIILVKIDAYTTSIKYPPPSRLYVADSLEKAGYEVQIMPFSSGIHADPRDFQRFTGYKLNQMLENDFKIKTIKKQGLYFTVLCYMVKQNILNIKSRLRLLLYWTFPLIDILVKLDRTDFVKNSKYMSSFTTGFFIVAVKKE